MRSVDGVVKMIRGEGVHGPFPSLWQAHHAHRHGVLDEETHDLRRQDCQGRLTCSAKTRLEDRLMADEVIVFAP